MGLKVKHTHYAGIGLIFQSCNPDATYIELVDLVEICLAEMEKFSAKMSTSNVSLFTMFLPFILINSNVPVISPFAFIFQMRVPSNVLLSKYFFKFFRVFCLETISDCQLQVRMQIRVIYYFQEDTIRGHYS